MVVYVAFIIFLRDSIRFEGPYVSKAFKDEEESDIPTGEPKEDFDESFEIISKNKNLEIITAENYTPEFKISKTTLKPPT